jgi:hypothetical protein
MPSKNLPDTLYHHQAWESPENMYYMDTIRSALVGLRGALVMAGPLLSPLSVCAYLSTGGSEEVSCRFDDRRTTQASKPR